MNRVLLTIGAFVVYLVTQVVFWSNATVALGHLAGSQFSNSDSAAVAFTQTSNFISGTGGLISIVFLTALALIWIAPIRRVLAASLVLIGAAGVATASLGTTK